MSETYNDFIDDNYVPVAKAATQNLPSRLKLDFGQAGTPGTVSLRIAPPMGALKAKGQWAQFRQFHYIPARKKDGSIGKRIVECVERSTWEKDPDDPQKNIKTITQRCPLCERHTSSKQKLESHENGSIVLTDSEVQLLREDAQLGVSRCYDVIAKGKDGKWGYAFIKTGVYKAIKHIIEELNADGIDALGRLGGVWFKISRKGKGITTSYSVTKEESKGTTVFAPLTDADIEQLKKFSPLDKQKTELMVHQLEQLVDSGMDPDAALTLLSLPTRSSAPQPRTPPTAQPLPPVAPPLKAAAKPAPAPQVAVSKTNLDDFLEDL